MKSKGYGMTAARTIEAGQIVMSCPPYVFVPYETRKSNVCAYCFKMFKPDPETTNTVKPKDNENDKDSSTPNPNPKQDSSTPNPIAQDSSTSNPKQDSSTLNPNPKEDSTTSDPKPSELDSSEKPNIETKETFPENTKIEDQASKPRPCSYCNEVYYCCEECQNLDMEEHYNYECPALQNLDVTWAKDYYQYCDDLITDVRLLIRALNKRQISIDIQPETADLDDFTEQYGHLISNKECYSQDVLLSLKGVAQLVNYLMPEEAQMDEDDLLDLYCKHRVNMFGIWGDAGECLGYGVYPRASFFNHSCWPNVTFYKNKEKVSPFLDFVTVYATPKDSEVSISYIDISEGLKPRRHTLKDKYFFHCECDRCVYQEMNPNAIDPYYDPQYYTDNEEGAV
eukprot:TRINITY_DN11794_c0_g1_i1.p1 TRINITY_DN11794_c0_g1~~TRINITY_DN11794_c0_g1_i1.p1  ORF type:complete len:396 (-),score=78.76 TRINITY_DN11794_c0_g1_i1:119-1306(-)